MDSISSLIPGSKLNNNKLTTIFGCSTQGGMRRSHRTNTLVLICNHVLSVYDDRWIDGVLHYTGMGLNGDQSLEYMQNKTLSESGSNGIDVHLFEVHSTRTYTYVGQVFLSSSPYQENQIDESGNQRKVWIFPIAGNSRQAPIIPVKQSHSLYENKLRSTKKLSDRELKDKAEKSGRKKVGSRNTTSEQFQRSPYVAEHTKRRANGICDLCNNPAPFKNREGEPYLETHHIQWLAKGGADIIENTVALCPNCHKKMHILDLKYDIQKLLNRKWPHS
jgi:5-methylcytosine-specific restriction protein A